MRERHNQKIKGEMVKEKLTVRDFKQFGGKHCETTALRNVLSYHGYSYSEEMLLGLGGGVGFIYWYMKLMPVPFIGTRYGKPISFALEICKRLGAKATMLQTANSKKAHEELKELLRQDEPVIVCGDIAYLPYFAVPEDVHFGGHSFVVFGIDEEDRVYISDRGKKAVTISVSDLQKARGSKFKPFPPKHGLLKIEFPLKKVSLKEGIEAGIKDCCTNMLNPPIKNIGLAGIKKWADIVLEWPKMFKRASFYGCLINTFAYIEIGGTGGSAFRTMYADFLREAAPILNKPALKEVAEMFQGAGRVWNEIATASLPDYCPTFKRVRELLIEKNKFFEEQGSFALDKMRKISEKLKSLEKKMEYDLKQASKIVEEMRERILKCYEVENKTFQELTKIIS